jgi:ABC-type sugar transport system ATPase subunit
MMKNRGIIVILMLVVLATGCAEKPLDEARAKQVAEELMLSADAGNYDDVEKLFSKEFLASEPMEVKQQKLQHLRNVLGEIKKYEWVSTNHVAEFGQPQKLVLEYRVEHARVTTREKYTIVEDEGGYKVGGHSVENEMEIN